MHSIFIKNFSLSSNLISLNFVLCFVIFSIIIFNICIIIFFIHFHIFVILVHQVTLN